MNLTKAKKGIFLILIICCFIGFIIPVQQAKAESKDKHVLYLSSYSYGWETVPLQIKGVKDALSDRCVINYEFMDTKNVDYGDDYKKFYDILKYKLSKGQTYDGVIVADDAALEFVQKYKDELFPNTPIAFTGIDDIENGQKAAKDPLISGITENVDYEKNIDIARKLMPKANKIVFINDRKENGIGIQKQLEKSTSTIKGCKVSYLISTEYTKEELEAKLRQIGDDTILYHVSLGQGKNNVTYTESERIEIIKNNVKVPVFRVSSPNFADIFLGGYVVDHEKCAYLASMMIKDTLDGKTMSEEKEIDNTPSVYCFNEEKMDKYNLSMSVLPKKTIIKNPKISFMEKHYLAILNIVIFACLLLLILILISIRRNLILTNKSKKIITEQKEELELALQAKEDFLSRMSHEMRTPLNSIIGCSHLAKINYDEQKDITEDLVMIDRAGGFLLNLINDILDVSRIEADKIQLNKEWCSPKAVVQSIEFMMIPIMKEKNINFEFPQYEESRLESVQWLVDPKRVQQVVINLLNNAAKFTPEGGTVKFKIKNITYDDRTSIDRVSVSDTGCGMTEEFMSHIGEAFTQEQNKYSDKVIGSGLGLFIVKKIVELMDGELKVESQLEKGSTFTFDIKYEYRMKNVSGIEKQLDEKQLDLKGMKVLYAEDSAMNQIVGKKLLEKKNVEVVLAPNGAEAIKIIQQSKEGEYHAVLMDMRMPVMGGIEATRKIRKLKHPDARRIPIIALSADAIITDVEDAKNQGLNEYLTKPIIPNELYKTLGKYWQDVKKEQ